MCESGILAIDGMNIVWNAKVFDEGSIFGINEGRISKLSAKIGNELLFVYDRGLDIKPQGEIAEKAFKTLIKNLTENLNTTHLSKVKYWNINVSS